MNRSRLPARSFARLVTVAAVSGMPAILALPLAAQEMPADRFEQMEREQRVRAHRQVAAPAPLSPAAIEALAGELQLAEEQQQNFQAILESYRLQIEQFKAREREDLLDLWPASFEWNPRERSIHPVWTPTLLELLEEHRDQFRRVINAESALFNTLAAQVDQEQARKLRAFQLGRLLSLHGFDDRSSAAISVRALLNEIELPEEERSSLEPIIAEHERRLQAMLSDRAMAATFELASAFASRMIAMPFEWPATADRDARMALRDAIDAEWRQSARGRVELETRQAVANLARSLPSRSAVQLRTEYLRQVAPQRFDEIEELLAFADEIRAMLQEEEGAAEDQITSDLEQIDRAVQVFFEDLTESFADDHRAQRVRDIERELLPRTAVLGGDDRAIDVAGEELARIDARYRQRAELQRLADALQAVASRSLPENETLRRRFERLRDRFEARNEADEYQSRALNDALDRLLENDHQGR